MTKGFPSVKQRFGQKPFNNKWYVEFGYCKTCEVKLPFDTRFCPDCRLPVRHKSRSTHHKFPEKDSQPIQSMQKI